MNPLELDILLHYYSCGNDYRDGDFTAPAVSEAIDAFRDDLDLLTQETDIAPLSIYKLTPRAMFYIEHILSIPLPEMRFYIPSQQEDT